MDNRSEQQQLVSEGPDTGVTSPGILRNNVILTLYASVALVASLSFYVTTWFVRARQKDLKAN